MRRRFGLEAAQVALGYERADVTQVYAEKNRDDYVTQLRGARIDPLTPAQLLGGGRDAIAGGRFRQVRFPRWKLRGEYPCFDAPGRPNPTRST